MRGVAGLGGKKVVKVGGDETIINAFRRRLRGHRRRKIDADQAIDQGAKSGAAEPGAATEIEHGTEVKRPSGRLHRLFDGITQDRRPAIGELLGERRVVARRVLVEQPAQVRFAHRRGGVAASEPGELQPGAVIILWIRVTGLFERGDGAGAVIEPVADSAEREPSGGETRREFHGLREDIGGAGKIAARGMIERPLVAPVGDEIAGGDEERPGVGHAVLASRRGMIIYHSHAS